MSVIPVFKIKAYVDPIKIAIGYIKTEVSFLIKARAIEEIIIKKVPRVNAFFLPIY